MIGLLVKKISNRKDNWFSKYSVSKSNFENVSKIAIFYIGDFVKVMGILKELKPPKTSEDRNQQKNLLC